jgi:hypothetical protein
MFGFVLLCSSFYYCASGVARDRSFDQLTVYTRWAVPLVSVTLHITGNVPAIYVLLSFLDAFGGIWTFFAMEKDRSCAARQPQAPAAWNFFCF